MYRRLALSPVAVAFRAKKLARSGSKNQPGAAAEIGLVRQLIIKLSALGHFLT